MTLLNEMAEEDIESATLLDREQKVEGKKEKKEKVGG